MWEGSGDIYGFGRQLIIIGESVVFEMSISKIGVFIATV